VNDLEAMKNAAALGNAFSARDDVIRAYALAFKGYNNDLMAEAVAYAVENCERLPTVKGIIAMYRKAEQMARVETAAEAVAYAVENCERLPTVKGIIAMYRKAEQMARVETAAEGVPCAYCRAAGGWNLPGSSRLVPEVRMATAPYLPGIMVKDDAGMTLGPAWTRLPACASHGLEQARKQGHGGYERPWVKERIDDLREWRDRWEGEHAVHAAAMIEQELAAHPSVTSFVTAAVNAPPPASVARTATLEPVVAPEPTQPETFVSVASLPTQGMTPDEIAKFDNEISF